jgi:sporulation protein YlmC with PRC-barrel domain
MPSPEPKRLVASSRVAGTAVFDLKGERLGHIDDLMIDKSTGRVAYAVLAFGGFLGFNDKHHPLPWGALRYDIELDGYRVDLDRKILDGAPSFPVTLPDNPAGPDWAQIDTYYSGRLLDRDVPLDPTDSGR